MAQFGIGQPARRLEDRRLVAGRGCFLDDINRPGQAVMTVLRSPHAHARIRGIDTQAAAAMPGVAAVLTGADLAADGLGPIPCLATVMNHDGSAMALPPRPALARELVRHVGDPVAIVLADTPHQGLDAVERITVDYEPLPAVVETAAATDPSSPQIWPQAPGNVCFDWQAGDRTRTDAAFARARHVTRLELINNRVVINSMEPRGAVAEFDAATGRFTLHASSQGVHELRNQLARHVLRVAPDRIRVITPDVGGGFGMKTFLYPEYVLALWAARRIGRAVKWVSGRAEAFLSDTQGRDHVSRAELALDESGRMLALRVDARANMGAYLSGYAPVIPTLSYAPILSGLYTLSAVHLRMRGVFTNTVPVDAYRGAGRPEAAYLLERMIDRAARELDLDPAELRRRNFIAPSALPFTTCMQQIVDSGEFARNLDDACRLADTSGAEQRKAEARKRGRLRGVGISTYVEACGGGIDELAEVRVDPSGAVTLVIGTQENGQGHHTAFAQILAERLGVPIERVRLVQGDTDIVPYGNGTGGSRALPVGGNAVLGAAEKVHAKARRWAAHLLEAAEADIEFVEGRFAVAGTDRAVTLREIAERAYLSQSPAPEGLEFGLAERERFLPQAKTFPNGCHVAEVEIDPETGGVTVERYTVVDDFGRVVNPLLLAGQVHGGVVQGIGQALHEFCRYDPESGQLVSGSLSDYALPRADDVPDIDFTANQFPCRTNPLGVKGAGEAGAVAAPPAIINAVIDALAPLGVRHIDMPATPERVWRAIRSAGTP
jgi:aerobic carbon-monoxide dehydrogenase large subunit